MSSGSATSTSIGASSPINEIFDDNSNEFSTYLHQLAGCYEVEVDIIIKEHSYARPWNWRPENIYIKPVKKLFFPKFTVSFDKTECDEEVDIEGGINESPGLPFDLNRTSYQMEELQRLAKFARPDENEDWEETIDKTLWSPVQIRIFTKVIRILTSERLARLAKANSSFEPIFRRLSVDVSAKRFREILGSVGWDWRITQWLHCLLFDNLPYEYLAIYLDILQTLRAKIPQLIDKMITVQPNISAKGGPITWEMLGSVLKRSWDPVSSTLNSCRLKKLPGNPILVMVPSGIGATLSARQHRWFSQLGALGMVVNIHAHTSSSANKMSMMVYIDQLIQTTRAKLQDVRNDCPARPIILVGFNTGAALACQVAQMEHVTAVICLGFPFYTVEGKRGTPDDTLMDIRCPVMFVIGQNSSLVRADDLEELREKMLVETSLVVVGSADDHLRISSSKKLSEGITQSMVDRCILEEMGDFVGSILLQPHPLPLRPTLSSYDNKNAKKEARKRKNSTSSSVESEPNSPTIKISRPSTPISSVPSGVSNAISLTSKSGAFNAQSASVSVGSQYTNHSSATKRKSRSINTQKGQFMEHLITSRISGKQGMGPGSGGITLNIGSLASLAPIGPIRLAPATDQTTPNSMSKKGSISKSTASSSKIVTAGVPIQNISKMKAVMSANKSLTKMISSGYRKVNGPEKGGDTKMLLKTTQNQVKVNTLSSMGHGNVNGGNVNGALSTILQNGKSPVTFTTISSTLKTPPTSSIILTPSDSTTSDVTSNMSTTKVMDIVGCTSNLHQTMSNSTQLDEIEHSTTISNTNNSSTNPASGNLVMITENFSNLKAASTPVITSDHSTGAIFSLSNKLKKSNKSLKAMPKITVNTNNLQRAQKNKLQHIPKTNLLNEIDADLGNILDIPIIFAKDDDNINNMEKTPTALQIPSCLEDKSLSKANNTTKVVLIKQEKHQQQTKLPPSTQAVICPNLPAHGVNHVILQTRPNITSIALTKRSSIQSISRSTHPTIKYTKIILTKRSTLQSNQEIEKIEPVLLTKPNERINASTVIGIEKSEHRYAQAQLSQHTKFH
ncbi:KAT8 regulatory NSL complex subunit 3 [Prorops nasuta]|uniref:KAT8 regulatory NSL complex subunit 3 n=1 Tax=Prorops nasuta TaxID=863751 RepID=UPI0034CF79F1